MLIWPLSGQEAALSPTDRALAASCQLKSCQLPRNSAETTYTTSTAQTGYEVGGLQCDSV